jgi:predicted enzyme related to lactoylglutathione lyase
MERVTGIGGFFFKAADPVALSRWYAEHLGVGLPPSSLEDDEAADEEWYQEAGPTVFAPFGPQHWESPHLGKHQWGVNFRVRDLDAMVAQLRYVGIAVEVDHQPHPSGRFAQLRDPEGNAVQLWEPAESGEAESG